MAEDNSKRYRGFFIALAFFGVGIMLSFGLCRVLLQAGYSWQGSGLNNLGGVSALVFLFSLLGFAVTLVGLIIALIINAFSNK